MVPRHVEQFLRSAHPDMEGKEKLIAIHGNRLLLHLVFSKLGHSFLESEVDGISTVGDLSKDMLGKLTAAVTKHFSAAYPGKSR